MDYCDNISNDLASQMTTNEQDQRQKKQYSIIPDLLTGWKPKNIKIPAPIIITYKSQLTNQIIQYYEDDQDSLIFMGPKMTNSLQFHEKIVHDYTLKYLMTSEELPNYFKFKLENKDHQKDIFRFEGMNINIKSNLHFESNFESGNLDLVIKVSENEYNLFLRPDTNTCGHMQWFNFKVKNSLKQKVKFNICNNKKAKTLYERGMKPYIFSKQAYQFKKLEWQQLGDDLTYSKLNLKEQHEEKIINGISKKVSQYQNFYCLSFSYTFEYENDEVNFAYCPPYTFSKLRNYINIIKKQNNSVLETIISQEKFCTSLSGIQIPFLTITDHSIEDENKVCIVVIGRIHPGETNSSFVMEGFINSLIKNDCRQIRKRVIFKIIPMINPDGVIFGNYRTSLSGKDLNRQFKVKSQQLIPEVSQLKNFIKKIKFQNKYKMTYFFDFHGHSLKKNVFFYGPQYQIWSIKYEKSKKLPRLISTKTDIFRLKSCLFKVANFKKSTARAFMLSFVPYCYTVQSSVGLYRTKSQIDKPFSIIKWKQIGSIIGESIKQILQKQTLGKNRLMQRINSNLTKRQPQLSKQSDKQNNAFSIHKMQNTLPIQTNLSKKYLDPIRNIKKKTQGQSKIMQDIQQEDCESDHFSEGQSDCESDDNDLTKKQYAFLKDKIINLIDDFQTIIVGKKKKFIISEKRDCKYGKIKKNLDKKEKIKKSVQQMLLVPSLRHKLNNLTLSQKKISLFTSFQGTSKYFRRLQE